MATDYLAGLRVLELTDSIAGAVCGLEYALAGAEVVLARDSRSGVNSYDDGNNTLSLDLFESLHRNKSLVDIEIAHESEDLLSWIRSADLVILDIAHKADLQETLLSLLESSPCTGVVCDRMMGRPGEAPSSELIWQVQSGFFRYVGEPSDAPIRVGADIAETTTGQLMFAGSLSVLVESATDATTQLGNVVKVSGIDALMSMKSVPLIAQSDPDDWTGFQLDGPYLHPDHGWKTRDGSVTWDFREGAEQGWREFVAWLGLEWVLDDPNYVDWRATIGLGDRRYDLGNVYVSALAERTTSEVVEVVRSMGGISVPVHDYESMLADEQVSGWVGWEQDGESGRTPLQHLGSPVVFDPALDSHEVREREKGLPLKSVAAVDFAHWHEASSYTDR